jgi:hypothetical protein
VWLTIRSLQSFLGKQFGISASFVIREVQKNHQGDTVLRGYAVDVGDTFGSPINPEHVEIV